MEYLSALPLGDNFTFAELHGLIEQYFASLYEAPKPRTEPEPQFILMTTKQLERYDSMLFWGREGEPIYRGLPIKTIQGKNAKS